MRFIFNSDTEDIFKIVELIRGKHFGNYFGVFCYFPAAEKFKQAGENRCQNYSSNFLKSKDALCPPNPNVLFIAALIFLVVAVRAL